LDLVVGGAVGFALKAKTAHASKQIAQKGRTVGFVPADAVVEQYDPGPLAVLNDQLGFGGLLSHVFSLRYEFHLHADLGEQVDDALLLRLVRHSVPFSFSIVYINGLFYLSVAETTRRSQNRIATRRSSAHHVDLVGAVGFALEAEAAHAAILVEQTRIAVRSKQVTVIA
jgi:hypothetical protein